MRDGIVLFGGVVLVPKILIWHNLLMWFLYRPNKLNYSFPADSRTIRMVDSGKSKESGASRSGNAP